MVDVGAVTMVVGGGGGGRRSNQGCNSQTSLYFYDSDDPDDTGDKRQDCPRAFLSHAT